jgi:hypothetical protein
VDIIDHWVFGVLCTIDKRWMNGLCQVIAMLEGGNSQLYGFFPDTHFPMKLPWGNHGKRIITKENGKIALQNQGCRVLSVNN